MGWKDWVRWDLNEDAKRKIDDTVENMMFANLPKGNVSEIADAVGKEELVKKMAGTTDKKSTAWKTARDTVTRWMKGTRKPKGESVAKVENAARSSRVSEYRSRGQVSVGVVGNWQTSKSTWKRGNVHANLSGQAKEDFLDAIERGDNSTAIQIVCGEYGLDPDLIENLDEIQGLTIN